jgi:hypothetical protein
MAHDIVIRVMYIFLIILSLLANCWGLFPSPIADQSFICPCCGPPTCPATYSSSHAFLWLLIICIHCTFHRCRIAGHSYNVTFSHMYLYLYHTPKSVILVVQSISVNVSHISIKSVVFHCMVTVVTACTEHFSRFWLSWLSQLSMKYSTT